MTQIRSSENSFDTDTLGKVQKVLEEFASTKSVNLLIANPVLLSPRWLKELRKANQAPETQALIGMLEEEADELRKQPWPLGAGPLDELFLKVKDGEIVKAKALALAASPDLFWRVSPNYVRRMSVAAEDWAREGNWRDGVLLSQLVLSMLDARKAALQIDQAEMELIATVHWLDVVTRAVCEVPDGRIFRDAVARGEKHAGIIVDPDGLYFPAAVLHGLGILYLDPYVGGRTNVNYEAQLREWRDLFRVTLAAENQFWDEETMSMPTPAEALQKAADYLGRAAEHRSGEQKGWTLKARLQALVWHWQVGLTPPKGEVERVGNEARQLLSKPEQPELENLLNWNASKLDPSVKGYASTAVDVAELLATPLDHWLESMTPAEVLDRYLQAGLSVESSSPQTAFALWTAVQELGWRRSEEGRMQFFQHGLNVFDKAFAPVPPLSGAGALAAALTRLKTSREPDEFTRAAKLLALAIHSIPRNEEEQAIEIVAAARAADVGFASKYAQFIDLMHANMLLNAAVNRFNAKQLDEAAPLYMECANAFLACDCPGMAFDAIERVIDLVDQGSERSIEYFIAWVGGLAVQLELNLEGAAEHLQGFYRTLMAHVVRKGTAKPIVLLLLVERAKGSAFERALINGAPLDWLEAPEARGMESRLDELRKQQSVSAGQQPDAALNYELVLSTYSTPLERSGGATVQEQRSNLEITFDSAVSRAQLAQGKPPKWLATDVSVQAALGARSALLSIYVGHMPNGDLAIFLMLLTNDSFNLTVGQAQGLNTNLIVMSDHDQRLAMTPFGPWVAMLRDAVQEDPLTRKVSARGARLLQDADNSFFGGGLKQKLKALHDAGKDHLYIWPHGPFHFLPFHLIGAENAPLAADWNVTYLPNLQLLDPARRKDSPLADFIAVGLDFAKDNPRGLGELRGAEAEAQEVVKVMGAHRSIVGKAVNKASVIGALRTHRRLHIASHGELPVSAPAFQSLYLGTDADSDVLYAYEILRLDLKGVDLVTLSACETALGRIDVGDNLRGFSGSLLIAGVSTIIGTLWPVETNCAKFFFVRLYTTIHGGASKGNAFRAAQAETRKKFPQYRDWGAFYLTGAIE